MKKVMKKTHFCTLLFILLISIVLSGCSQIKNTQINNSNHSTNSTSEHNMVNSLEKINLLMKSINERIKNIKVNISTPDEKLKLGTNKSIDSDEDGIPDIDETKGTLGFITNPNNSDTDSDGLSDLREYWWACDPTNPDTNGDFISDGDSVNNKETYPYVLSGNAGLTLGSLDIDNDGIPTAAEKFETGTDYKVYSTDGDRYGDGEEYFGVDTKQDFLPGYVIADPLSPAVPDISIKINPKIGLNLAEKVVIGNNKMNKGEHTYTTEKESTQTTTVSAGTKLSTKATAGWPPFDSGVQATAEAYVGIDYSSSSRTSKITTDTQTTSYEAYTMKEVDLSGSKLQLWIDVINSGTDILTTPLKEIKLNLYMGNDKLPFDTERVSDELTNLQPGKKITLTFNDIDLNYKLFQRLISE